MELEGSKNRGAWGGKIAYKRPTCLTLLRQWLDEKGMTLDAFARLVGCNTNTAKYWRAGQTLPDIVYAFRIDEVTQGGVPVSSWMGTEIAEATWRKRFGQDG